jgi:GntR family transcriptional regulator
MPWDFQNDRPIYLQLMEKIMLQIVSGRYRAGDKLASVRDMAAEAGVNPNTMQKALAELEREGLVFAQRTSGRYITDDMEKINSLRVSLAKEQVSKFLKQMENLGYAPEDTVAFLKNNLEEEH